MPWLKVNVKSMGNIKQHRAYINLEYAVYIGESSEGFADIYLTSENWLCTKEKFDDLVSRIEALERE